MQGKSDTLITTLHQQWQQQRAHCWMLSGKLLPPRVTGVSTPSVPWFLPNEKLGCGWSRQCIQMTWWRKNWSDREQWQNLFSRKSENLYKEKFHTSNKNLAKQPIEVHSFVFCWCHQNRLTTRGQWTPKSKGSLVVTCHYSQTKFVSIFMQHTVYALALLLLILRLVQCSFSCCHVSLQGAEECFADVSLGPA